MKEVNLRFLVGSVSSCSFLILAQSGSVNNGTKHHKSGKRSGIWRREFVGLEKGEGLRSRERGRPLAIRSGMRYSGRWPASSRRYYRIGA